VVTIEAHKEFWQKCRKQFLWVSFSRNSLVHVLAGTMDGFDAEFRSPTGNILIGKIGLGVSIIYLNQLGFMMTLSPTSWTFSSVVFALRRAVLYFFFTGRKPCNVIHAYKDRSYRFRSWIQAHRI
jgi:hypothetical protein